MKGLQVAIPEDAVIVAHPLASRHREGTGYSYCVLDLMVTVNRLVGGGLRGAKGRRPGTVVVRVVGGVCSDFRDPNGSEGHSMKLVFLRTDAMEPQEREKYAGAWAVLISVRVNFDSMRRREPRGPLCVDSGSCCGR